MKFEREYTLKEIAKLIDVKYVGSDNFSILGMNEIHLVEEGDIVFVDNPKYYDKALNSKATTILIDKKVTCPDKKTLLISDNPFRDFNKLIKYFRPFTSSDVSISKTAKIGHGTIIQPNSFIGNNVVIGNNCLIHSNVSIYDNCIIGDNVTIHANTILGADAFYYKKRDEGFDKLISGGRVVIKDNVDIGAGCTIDRGVTGDTTIGKGSKLDNQIQIGHDTVLGEKCLVASHTGIAGCVVIEDEVTFWGQAGIVSGITIGKGAVVLAQSGVANSLKAGKTYFGTPAIEARDKMREIINVKKIPSIIEKLEKS